MGELKHQVKRNFDSFRKTFGLKREAPSKAPMPGMPDEDAISMEAKRKRAKQALKGGRATTILDNSEETLG